MLSDEEKKAIEKIKSFNQYNWDMNNLKEKEFAKPYFDALDTILNLIEKQSKEIEELKTINQMQKYRIEVIDERELISKDKIKEILGIEEDINNEKLLSLLQTIVDENARLEDIEDRKVQIEYNNVFNKGVKSVEDKIKAIIEELQEDIKYSANPLSIDNSKFARNVLQSLLEKK